MSTHSVIIAAHGAALTNAAFIQPGTIVVEVFPTNYFLPDFFRPLIEQAGGLHIPYTRSLTPEADAYLHGAFDRGMKGRHEREFWRGQDILLDDTDTKRIVHLIMQNMDSTVGASRLPPPASRLRSRAK